MNEEQMRKEFEEWCVSHGFTLRLAETNCGIVIYGEYGNQRVQIAWQAWQASRQAMKPIEFPAEIELDLIGDQVAPTHQNSYAEGYNDALSDLELKITELSYKVEG